jgi:hypothetical protein
VASPAAPKAGMRGVRSPQFLRTVCEAAVRRRHAPARTAAPPSAPCVSRAAIQRAVPLSASGAVGSPARAPWARPLAPVRDRPGRPGAVQPGGPWRHALGDGPLCGHAGDPCHDSAARLPATAEAIGFTIRYPGNCPAVAPSADPRQDLPCRSLACHSVGACPEPRNRPFWRRLGLSSGSHTPPGAARAALGAVPVQGPATARARRRSRLFSTGINGRASSEPSTSRCADACGEGGHASGGAKPCSTPSSSSLPRSGARSC